MSNQTHQQQLEETLKINLSTLFQLPNLSPIVREVLKSWIDIRKAVKKTIGSKKQIFRFKPVNEDELAFLDQMRHLFERKFGSLPEFQTATTLSRNITKYDRRIFRSIRFYGVSKGHSFLFPWLLFVEARYNDDTPFLQVVVENLLSYPKYRKLPEFVDLLVTDYSKSRIKLSPLAVQFLNAITQPELATTKHGFPSQMDIANYLGCSERTVSNLQNLFSILQVISPRYLANMGKLGFVCFRIIHRDPLPSALAPLTLRSYFLDRWEFLSIVYIPLFSKLLEYLPRGKISEIANYRIVRNFGQLHYKPEKSWIQPIRLLGDTGNTTCPSKSKISFNLIPKRDSSPRPLFDFYLLDQIQLIGSGTYSDLAKTLNVSETYLKERLIALIGKENLIAPFYFVSRVGLTTNILVAFEGNLNETKQIINNLMTFPYIELFFGPEGGCAILKVPETWIGTFLADVINLRHQGIDIWATISFPTISRWGIPLANIVEKDDFFGLLWDYDDEKTVSERSP